MDVSKKQNTVCLLTELLFLHIITFLKYYEDSIHPVHPHFNCNNEWV